MKKPNEEWKDIYGFGYYQISSLGRVKSFHPKLSGRTKEGCRNMVPNERILTPTESENGYLKVTLRRQKKPFKRSVHHLVAQAFVYKPYGTSEVNHKDENKKNNIPENLEWCTHKYNCNYGTRNIRQKASMINNPLVSIPVIQLTKTLIMIAEFPSVSEASRTTGAAISNILNCCKGKKGFKTSKGYKWRFKYE